MDESTELIVRNVSRNGITFICVATIADGFLPDPLPRDYAWSFTIRKIDKSW
jgi:hypothetical protein